MIKYTFLEFVSFPREKKFASVRVINNSKFKIYARGSNQIKSLTKEIKTDQVFG